MSNNSYMGALQGVKILITPKHGNLFSLVVSLTFTRAYMLSVLLKATEWKSISRI